MTPYLILAIGLVLGTLAWAAEPVPNALIRAGWRKLRGYVVPDRPHGSCE